MRGDMPLWDGSVDKSGWQDLQLINGWVNFDSGVSLGGGGRSCQAMLLNGVVWLTGFMRSGTMGTDAFILPVGMRPRSRGDDDDYWTVATNNTVGFIGYHGSTYGMRPTFGSSVWFNLAGISFPAAA